MIPYAIGFDIGITSVGWAVVALDSADKPYGIINMGSRVFDAAEQPKTGASLAAPRREARSARRRLRRHQHRLERIRRLLLTENVISQAELDTLFAGKLEGIYTLRVKALDAPVSHTEFAHILLHIAQRRGFAPTAKPKPRRRTVSFWPPSAKTGLSWSKKATAPWEKCCCKTRCTPRASGIRAASTSQR